MRLYRVRVLGSSASRNPSPIKLKTSTVTNRNTPGKTDIHQACCNRGCPALMIPPHVGVVDQNAFSGKRPSRERYSQVATAPVRKSCNRYHSLGAWALQSGSDQAKKIRSAPSSCLKS